MQTKVTSTKPKTDIARQNFQAGIIILLFDIALSVAAQLVLKSAMRQIGAFPSHGNWLIYFSHFIHPLVITGLFLYGLATILWVYCLTKLDLSFAYPAATVQYFLIFLGAWHFFGEHIPPSRLIGLLIITVGVIIISFDKDLT